MTKSNYYEEDNAEGEDNDGEYGVEGIEEEEVYLDEEYDGTEEKAATANKNNYDEVDDKDEEEMATVKIVMN